MEQEQMIGDLEPIVVNDISDFLQKEQQKQEKIDTVLIIVSLCAFAGACIFKPVIYFLLVFFDFFLKDLGAEVSLSDMVNGIIVLGTSLPVWFLSAQETLIKIVRPIVFIVIYYVVLKIVTRIMEVLALFFVLKLFGL